MVYNQRLLFLGPAGAGKSTIIDRLSAEYGLKSVDVQDLVYDYFRETGKSELVGDELKEIYRMLIRKLPSTQAELLEISNDWPEEFFDTIVALFFNGNKGLLVCVDISLPVSLSRVSKRASKTPESTIKRHHAYGYDYFEMEAMRLGIPIVKVSGEDDPELNYAKIREHLVVAAF